jgi:hypothetical protein
MKKKFSSVILPPILSICLASALTACGGSSSGNSNTANEDNSPSINEPNPAPGDGNQQEDQTGLASWQELLGTWDASELTEDDSDSIFVILQANGNADYFNFNNTNNCYDKISIPLIDQNDGTFAHQDTGYLVSFQLNTDKTEAIISNNQDDTRYTITKTQQTEEQLSPVCTGEQPGDGNGEQPGDGNGEQPGDGSSPATWQELLGTWDASAATEDNSDTIYVIMKENGDADYLTFDNLETCYEKTTLTLVDQGNGEFKHQESDIVLTFTLNADKTAAQVTNSFDSSEYIIIKDSQTEADLTPICGPVVVEPPAEEVFSNATFADLISGNGIWNASTQVGDQVDVQYVAFTEGSGFFSSDKIHYIDYKNDGIDGVNSDCYKVESTAIRDRGDGNFSDLKLFNPNIIHLEVNQDVSLLHGTYLANDTSMLLNKEGIDNLTMESFNECP